MTGHTSSPGAAPVRDTFALAQPKAATRAIASPASTAREVTLAGRRVPYQVRVSARARAIRLVIRPATGLEVVLPR
ncbi:MAG: hypothetical protein ACRDHE_17835, partial [Ktedonobacterales bacterium]